MDGKSIYKITGIYYAQSKSFITFRRLHDNKRFIIETEKWSDMDMGYSEVLSSGEEILLSDYAMELIAKEVKDDE